MTKIDVPGIHKIKEEMDKKSNDYEEAKILMVMLSEERGNDSSMCYNIGKHLYSIDDRLLTEWIKFSKYYNKEMCKEYWNKFKYSGQDKLAMGSLRLMASLDNPVKYVQYQYNRGEKTSQLDEINEIPFNTESAIQKLRTNHRIKSFDFSKGKKLCIEFESDFNGDMTKVCETIVKFANKYEIKMYGAAERCTNIGFERDFKNESK